MAGELKPRILRLPIGEDFAGKTIKEYLMKQIGFSSRQLSRFKYRRDGIMLNGERRYVNYVLKAGDVLEIRLTQGGEPAKEEMRDTCRNRAGDGVSGRDAFRGAEPGGDKAGCAASGTGFGSGVSRGAEPGEKTAGVPASGAGFEKDSLTDGKQREAAGLYSAAGDGRLQKIWFAPASWLAEKYPLRILYEDQDILVADKPPGVVCHPSPGHFEDTLSNQVAEHLGRIGRELDVRVTGRLDKDTSGIVIFALNTETAAQLIKQRRASMMSKLYIARVRGHFSGNAPGDSREADLSRRRVDISGTVDKPLRRIDTSGTVDKPLRRVDTSGTVDKPLRRIDISGTVDKPLRRKSRDSFLMITAPDGKAARTHFRALVEMEDGTTLVACRIEHGRTHQIRVHMSSIGHPLVGDRLYGIEAGEDDRDLFSRYCRFGSNPENSVAESTGSSITGKADLISENSVAESTGSSITGKADLISENSVAESTGSSITGTADLISQNSVAESTGSSASGIDDPRKESGSADFSGAGQAQRTASEKQEASEVPLMLHAFRAELIQPFTREKIVLEAPLPEWAKAVSDIFV